MTRCGSTDERTTCCRSRNSIARKTGGARGLALGCSADRKYAPPAAIAAETAKLRPGIGISSAAAEATLMATEATIFMGVFRVTPREADFRQMTRFATAKPSSVESFRASETPGRVSGFDGNRGSGPFP